jgi:hypothetical protein
MSNIMPQSGANNQGPWVNFETYCRTLTNLYEMLIICGPSGFGSSVLPSGKVYIPSNSWKVVVCVPLGSGTALSRISVTNRVIAISVPNVTNGLSTDWRTYVTSPKKIEQDTGFTFFTALPASVANTFRLTVDGTPTFSTPITTNNQFRFTVNGWTGTNYVVQAITNITSTNWSPVLTNAAPFVFVQSNLNLYGQRYYRAVKP